jgi:putative intracellular protease/amidase
MASKNAVSDYLSKIGRKGGKVTGVAKGTAALSEAERKRRGKAAAAARWGKKRAVKRAA